MLIAHVVFPVPVDSHFDYIVPGHLEGAVAAGCRVVAVFARKKTVGVVVGLAAESAYPDLITLIRVCDGLPVLSPAMLEFARVFSMRHACSLGEAVFLMLPAALCQVSLRRKLSASAPVRSVSGKPGDRSLLIFDRGLERRWEILLPKMREVLAAGRGVLVLVPEGSYVEPVLSRLEGIVPPEQRTFLRQGTVKEEYERWLRLLRGEVRLAAGFLSAVFAPVNNLGLIVLIDEESRFYKSDQSPFYHAREVAFLRAGIEGAAVICVSSAPSVECWQRTEDKEMSLEVLDAALPPVRFLDIANFKMKKGSLLSPGLRLHLENVIKSGGRAVLYVPAGKGTAFVLEELSRFLPQARAAGYDRSSSVMPDAQVLVATQAVFRYRGRLSVEFAAVLDIDYEFHKADHRAAQAAFALVQYLRQMSSRGVLLQTRQPHSPLLHALASDRYQDFYQAEVQARKEMGFPPFGALAALVVRSVEAELACAEAKRLYDIAVANRNDGINVMEPQQDRSVIAHGKFRWCVMLQGDRLTDVSAVARKIMLGFRGRKDAILTVNIDP